MPKIQKNSSEVTERNVSASQIAAKTKITCFLTFPFLLWIKYSTPIPNMHWY